MATDINLDLSDELEAKLRARIEKDQVELNEFVRQAVAEKLAREPQQSKSSAYEIWRQYSDGYDSGRADVSENTRKYVREAILAKHRRRSQIRR